KPTPILTRDLLKPDLPGLSPRLSRHTIYFIFFSHGPHRDLPSFPTRRSSDLLLAPAGHFPQGDPPVVVAGQIDLSADAKAGGGTDRKSTRLNSSHVKISYAVFCLKKKNLLLTARPGQRKAHNVGPRYGCPGLP